MIKKLLTLLIVLIAAIAVVAAMQPADFSVERSATYDVPAQTIFEHVNDLHKWQEWSPWAKIDPSAMLTYDGPQAGVGAAMAWSSENREVGKGRMTITDSRINELIKLRLDFTEPMQATNTADFRFKSNGSQTTVTWSMSGQKNFLMKVIGLFMNCEQMVGDEFDKGLANLKSVAK